MKKKTISVLLLTLFIATAILPASGDKNIHKTEMGKQHLGDEQEGFFQLYLGRIYNPVEKWIGSEWTFELTFNAVSVFYVSGKPPFFQWLRNGVSISIIIGVGGFNGLVDERFICVIQY